MEERLPGMSALLLSGWMAVNLSGCSLIGFAIGAAGDSTVPDAYVYSPGGLDSLEQGRDVTVFTVGGNGVSGEYAGLDSIPDGKYDSLYTIFLASSPLGTKFPAMGDTVRIITRGALGRGEVEGVFSGFSRGLVKVRSTNSRPTTGVFLEFIDTVYHGRDQSIGGDSLRESFLEGAIPLMNPPVIRLLLVRERHATAIPLDQIREIHAPNARNQKWIGLGVGALVDGFIIYWAATEKWNCGLMY